jgi:hypothetical protein
MKCIISVKDTRLIRRVANDEAARLVATGQWTYCPKQLWKRHLAGSKIKEKETEGA